MGNPAKVSYIPNICSRQRLVASFMLWSTPWNSLLMRSSWLLSQLRNPPHFMKSKSSFLRNGIHRCITAFIGPCFGKLPFYLKCPVSPQFIVWKLYMFVQDWPGKGFVSLVDWNIHFENLHCKTPVTFFPLPSPTEVSKIFYLCGLNLQV